MVTNHVSVTEARNTLKDLVNRVVHHGERIALDRYGTTEAVLVSPEDAALLEKIEDQIDIEAADKAMKKLDTVPWSKVKKQLGL